MKKKEKYNEYDIDFEPNEEFSNIGSVKKKDSSFKELKEYIHELYIEQEKKKK